MVTWVWIFLIALALSAMTWRGNQRKTVLKSLVDLDTRSQAYLGWTFESALWLLGLSGLCFYVADVGSPFAPPPPYLLRGIPDILHRQSASELLSMGGGLLTASVLLGVLEIIKSRISGSYRPMLLGDVSALLPRTNKEILACIPLCLNAGFSEEILFRYAMPVLLYRACGSATTALVTSAVVFGAAHFYQGWKGVASTTVAGLGLSGLYLYSGSLWFAVGLHAFMDLMSVVVRPWIVRQFIPTTVQCES